MHIKNSIFFFQFRKVVVIIAMRGHVLIAIYNLHWKRCKVFIPSLVAVFFTVLSLTSNIKILEVFDEIITWGSCGIDIILKLLKSKGTLNRFLGGLNFHQ